MFGCAPKMGDTSVHCCNFSAKHVHLHLESDDINHEILGCPIFRKTSKHNPRADEFSYRKHEKFVKLMCYHLLLEKLMRTCCVIFD